MGSFSSVRFKPGDYVKFIALQWGDYPHGCNDVMEERLYGKIFQVVSTDSASSGTYQEMNIAICDFSEDVNENDLHWNFSSPMFELFLPPTNEVCFSFSFDDLLNVLSEASTCEK